MHKYNVKKHQNWITEWEKKYCTIYLAKQDIKDNKSTKDSPKSFNKKLNSIGILYMQGNRKKGIKTWQSWKGAHCRLKNKNKTHWGQLDNQ